jgi:hypothetical protein
MSELTLEERARGRELANSANGPQGPLSDWNVWLMAYGSRLLADAEGLAESEAKIDLAKSHLKRNMPLYALRELQR